MKNPLRIAIVALVLGATFFASPTAIAADGAKKKIVLLAGKPSHPPGQHEHNAGILLFKKCLADVPGIEVFDFHNGEWPTEAIKTADAVVFYCDGGKDHMALQGDHLQELDAILKKGTGLGCVHYATEPTKEKGETEFLEWIGGAFEPNWSVNPIWEAEFKTLPKHEVTRGVKPFHLLDELYFHLRFREGMQGVTPILSAVAPESTMSRKDSTHGGNPAVRESVAKGEQQTVMWVAERAGGGRGFGFTGGHLHANWGNDDQRKVVLNAILWIAHVAVPANGVESKVTEDDLKQNLDPKAQPKKAN